MKIIRLLLCLTAILVLVNSAAAASILSQPVQLVRTVTGSGYSNATVGDVSLRATLGQPFVGETMNGGITLKQGFWHGVRRLLLYLPMVLSPTE
jgi:hypothetical protein